MTDLSLLPPNASDGELAIEGAISRIGDVPTPIRDMWNPDTCPVALLPWLAWAFSVDDWDSSWTEDQKRNAIKAAYEVQRHKGTIGAVKSALSALGYSVEVQEWFNQTPAADPYTFKLLLDGDQIGIDQAALNRIISVVTSNKNLRSHMDTAVPGVTTTAGPITAAVTNSGNEIDVTFGNYRTLDGSFSMNGGVLLNGINA